MVRDTFFGALSKEELEEVAVVEPVVADIPVEEVIEGDAEIVEMHEIAGEIEDGSSNIDKAVEVAGELEEQVAANDTLLETPEAVTETAVVVAQESFKTCMRLLGTPEKYKPVLPSHENISAGPVMALKMSNENIKEFIASIIAGIKASFAKLVVALRKWWVKALVAINRSSSVAEGLKAKLKGLDDKDAKFTDEQEASIKGKIGCLVVANGGIKTGAAAAAFKEYLAEDVAGMVETAKAAIEGVQKETEAIFATEGEVDATKVTEAVKALSKENLKLAGKLATEAGVTGHITYMAGNKYKVITVDGADDIKTLSVKSETHNVSKEKVDGITVECTKINDITDVLTIVVTNGKQLQAGSKAALGLVDATDKWLTAMGKKGVKSEDASVRVAAVKTLNAIKVFTLASALDGITSAMACNNDALVYANACIGAYSKK